MSESTDLDDEATDWAAADVDDYLDDDAVQGMVESVADGTQTSDEREAGWARVALEEVP